MSDSPQNHLAAIMADYPDLPQYVDNIRSDRGKGLPRWPDWCFVPCAAWYAVACNRYNTDRLTPAQAADIAPLAALAAWRYSQGIYRIDADLLAALLASEMSGDLASDVLHRLPQWCIYIETPGMRWFDAELAGFWVCLEWDANGGPDELRLLLNTDTLHSIPLHIGQWPVSEAVQRYVSVATSQAAAVGLQMDTSPDLADQIADQVNKLVSLVLYVCSYEADIINLRRPDVRPERPRPKRVKGGRRLFPVSGPTIWTIGQTIGQQLRQQIGERPDYARSPHIRRAHWHGYWTGPRDGDRKMIYHWLPPQLISGYEPPDD